MEYFKLLHLDREPFSNSPDPAFFYESGQHKDCLQNLEIALRLRRGLNVVIGEVGTGKTTLCRQLIQAFSDDPEISACLLLDPDFPDSRSFLGAVLQTITGHGPAADDTIPAMKEQLKHYLFQKGVEEDRTIVLIVDEGQKMAPDCLETLRELLNFETNEYKLFQVIIFAQNEFSAVLERLPNLADRINLYYRLGPLNFKDTRALIRHRIRLAGGPEAFESRLFHLPALWRIFRLSGGYPRKIVHLCHQCLLAMIIQNKAAVSRRIVGACARRTFVKPGVFRPLPVGTTLAVLAVVVFGAWHYSGKLQRAQEPVQAGVNHSTGAVSPAGKTGENAALETSAEGPSSTGTLPMAGPSEAAAVPLSPEKKTSETGKAAVSFHSPGREDAASGTLTTVLGRVPVVVGDTLGGLVQKVYGVYTYRYNQAVLAANPQLIDPDSLIAGQTLVFPAVSTDMGTMPETTWWVALSREPDLESAVSRLRQEAAGGLPLRILAAGNPEEGLSFRIVLKTCFDNENAAELAKEQLALSASMTAEVICLKKNEETIYGTPGIPVQSSTQAFNKTLQEPVHHNMAKSDSAAGY